MGHIELKLSKMLERLLHPGRSAQRRFLMMHLAALDPLPLGPGWFDSSWELEQGLEVNEDVGLDVALQRRFDDAMLEAALARLRASAARAAKHKSGAAPAVVEPGVAAHGGLAAGAMPLRGDNLIEFEMPETGTLKLPRNRPTKIRTEVAELELTLA